MKLSSLTANEDLQSLIKGSVLVNEKPIDVYVQGERSLDNTPSEFIEIFNNGAIRTDTESLAFSYGTLSLAMYVTSNNGLINKPRQKYILEQVQSIIDCASSDKFFFTIDTQNLITNNNNLIIGYSATVITVRWRAKGSITI